MMYQSLPQESEPVINYEQVLNYGPLDRSKEADLILRKCEETNGSGLIIEDNTIYEIDCECYRKMLERKAKKNNCVDPFQS